MECRTGRHRVAVIANSILLKRNEAAERLRQSVRNTDKLIASGELPSVRIGRSVLVRESAIEYFIEARESRVKVTINRKRRAAIEGGTA